MEATIEKIGFQTYPAYKNSGVEWLGEIPENWSILRLGAFGTFAKGGGFSKANLSDDGTRAVLYGDIYTKYNIKVKEAVRFIPNEIAAKSISIQAGDLLFTGSGETKEEIGKCVVFLGSNKTVAGGDVIIFRSKIHSKTFLSYALNTEGIKFENAKNSKGEIVVHTYASKLKELRIPIPPLPEQKAIAEFLDKKTALIDKAIQIKEKQIDLLQERRQILIQQAVTRGLDPNVPLKDSGVVWIGMIPEHWEVKRLKYLVQKSFSGGTPSTDKLDYWDGGIPWLSSADIKSDYLAKTSREISIEGLKNSSSKTAPKGSLVFVTRSGILQHTFALSILEIDMAINQDIKCLILKNSISSEYLHKMIKGNNDKILVEVRQQAATVESIDMDAFFNLEIPVPDKLEQKKISNYITTISLKVETALGLKEKEIEKLKEYKSTLINSAVTGKIKVS